MGENSRNERILPQRGEPGKPVVELTMRDLLVVSRLRPLVHLAAQTEVVAPMATSTMAVIHGKTIKSPATIQDILPTEEIPRVPTYQTAPTMEIKAAGIREVDTKEEEIKEAVIMDGNHIEVVTRGAEDITQGLTETILRTEGRTTIATHPFIEVGTKKADTKVVGIGVEETQVVETAEDGFKGLTVVETPQSWLIIKVAPAWTRQTVGPHPKLLENRETTGTAMITRTRVTDTTRTSTTGQPLHEDVMMIVEEVLVILAWAVGKGVQNNSILRRIKLPHLNTRRDSHGGFGLMSLLINCAHVLMGVEDVAALSMDSGKEVAHLVVIRHLT